MKSGIRIAGIFIGMVVVLGSCSLNQDSVSDSRVKVSVGINPSTTYQEIIGFGGAISWYCERITNSNQKGKISELLFEDLGTDIIRFKNWYYPDGYPSVKSTASMTDDNAAVAFEATNSLYISATLYNPDIKFLLSSWGPPAGLKSNNSSRQGTLKADANGFMYDAFATYWSDILDHIAFQPDYISIQNEPSYVNSGWTTCEWAAVPSATLPGYDIAFDKVALKMQARQHPPLMVGPESASIGPGANGNIFSTFADVIRDKPALDAYAYHPYNFDASSNVDQSSQLLQMVGAYSNKPNMMTEFSGNMNWFATALFIHNTMVYANSSAYIYWKMIWAPPTPGADDDAMISIDANGQYKVTPFYYVIKHFAIAINRGYKRVEITSGNAGLRVSAYIDPSRSSITIVALNLLSIPMELDLGVTGAAIQSIAASTSIQDNYFILLDNITVGQPLAIPGLSITTVVLGL